MKDFFEHNFNISKIILACYVAVGTGDAVHKDRPSHGLALHLSGSRRYVFENHDEFVVKAGDIIYLPQGSTYVVDTIADGDCYAVNFLDAETESFPPFVFGTKNTDKFTDMFRLAEKVFREKTNGYEMMCKAQLYLIICAMLKEYEAAYMPQSKEKLIWPAIEYIHEKYADEIINIDFLSRLCGMSPAYFRRIFYAHFGTSPVKYINALRLKRAKELIKSGFYGMDDVCTLSGFSDIYYFYRYFKKETGLTPKEYKET